MADLTAYLPSHLYHLWIIIGLAFMVGEVMTGGFVLLWFAIGSFVAALFAFVGSSVNAQLLAFGISSLALFSASRSIFRNFFIRGRPGVPTNVDAMIGKRAEVLEQIGPGTRAGTVRVGGETWDAVSAGSVLNRGTLVTVEGLQGLTLKVRPADQPMHEADAKGR